MGRAGGQVAVTCRLLPLLGPDTIEPREVGRPVLLPGKEGGPEVSGPGTGSTGLTLVRRDKDGERRACGFGFRCVRAETQ